MEILFKSSFTKQYKKLPPRIQEKFNERLLVWLSNPADSLLRVHALTGKYTGYWSMNVSGDIRALYKHEGDTIVIFVLIGSHSALYG